MAILQETVDDIRSYTAAGRHVARDQVETRATNYARGCRDANDRLRRCYDALQRGLRSDAIQIAEAEPNLLDMVAMLDFPELPAWKELCQSQEIPAPPELLMEMAAALNEAYAAEQPLTTLLANHRIMALGRAPLHERITTMRRIAELDSASAFWDDDIKRFEQARLDEIRNQLGQAVKGNDAAVVSRFRDEVEKPGWRISIPQELRRVLQESAIRLESNQAIAELRQMLPALNGAYGGMAYEECQLLLGQWSGIVATANLTVPTELQEQVDPIFGWVHDEETRRNQAAAFEQACTFLEQAIDRDQPTPSLERAYQAVIAFHQEVPEELDKRYRQRLAARAAAIRHRRQLIYTGIAAGFVLIAGVITFIAYQRVVAGEISDAHNVLNEALNDVQQGDPDKGQSLKKQLISQHPRILSSAAIMKQLSDFDAAVAAEQKREADFQLHMQAAITSGVEKPSDLELDAATSLAKTAGETAQIDQFKSNIDAVRLRREQDADRQFAADGVSIGTDLDQKLTAQLMVNSPDQYSEQLDAIGKRVDELRGRQGVSGHLKEAQLASLDAVVERDRHELEHQQTTTRLLDAVKKSASTAERHAAALKDFISACPDDARCSDFQLAVAMLPQEQAVEEWSTLVTNWASQMVPMTYQDAKDRALAVQQYIDRNGTSPVVDAAKAYKDYLNLGLETAAPDGPWKGKFSKLLSNPVVGNLYCLDTPDGKRYYVTADAPVQDITFPAGGHKCFRFNAITTPDLTNQSSLTEVALNTTSPVKSPQALFAEAATNRIDRLGFQDWDTLGLSMIEQLVSLKDMNLVLRAILLQHVLQLDQPVATWGGEDGFVKTADALVEQNVEDVEWLDPRHPADAGVTKKMQATIDQLPGALTDAKAEIVRKREAIMHEAAIAVAGEGILLKQQDKFQVFTSTPSAAGQMAFVIGADKKLEQIAAVSGGQWSLDSTTANTTSEGSLIFIVAARR